MITWRSTGGTRLGSGKISYSGKALRKLKLTLNAAGKKAFGKARHPHLVITGSFTPKGGTVVSASKKFTPAA